MRYITSMRESPKAALLRVFGAVGVALGLLLGVAPSASALVMTTHGYYHEIYRTGLFGYVAGGRDLRVVVTGNPTAAPQDAFDQAVVAAMQGRNWGPTTHFTTRPSETAREAYWVSMIFGGDHFIGERAICRGGAGRDIDPGARPVRLQAAFCERTKPITSLMVTVNDVASPDDPRLEAMVSAAVVELFPLPNGITLHR